MSDVARHLLATAIIIFIAIVVYGITVRIGNRFVRRFDGHSKETAERVTTLWALIRRIIMILIVSVAFLLILSAWEVNLTPFLAVGTVVGAAIGFGAQDLVKDFLAGFFILAEDQYHIGDTVTIAGTTGSVEDIQLRVTVLRDFEGNVHFVPNGQITVASNFTSNYSMPVLDIGVGYGENVDDAMQVIIDEMNSMFADENWRSSFRGEPEMLGVQQLDDSAVIVRVRLITDADERWTVRREALRRIKNRLDMEGIEIPFPQVAVHTRDSR